MAVSLSSYNLPICDVDKEKRNFPSYEEHQYYSVEEMSKHGQDSEGTTDTDVNTHKMEGYNTGGGYSRIFQTQGKKIKK